MRVGRRGGRRHALGSRSPGAAASGIHLNLDVTLVSTYPLSVGGGLSGLAVVTGTEIVAG